MNELRNVGLEESSDDLMLLSDGDLFRALVAAKKDCEKENDENAVSLDRLVDCFKKRVANEISVKKNTVILYREEAASALANGKTVPEVYYHHFTEDLKAFLGEKDGYSEVVAIYRRIKPCVCGGTPELHDYETMGSGYYEIRCKSCPRSVIRGPEQVEISGWDDLLEACIRDWNEGLYL